MKTPRYTATVQKLPASVPFVGPETQERARGAVFDARLGANENVFGPSPKAISAMANAASDCWKYGDPENFDLKEALATFHGVKPENIVVGEGIDGLLGYLVRMLINPGDRIVTSLGAYPTFNFHVAGFGGELITVPFSGDHEDLPALLAKSAEVDAKLCYFANPDNPMGTITNADKIEAAMADIPEGTLLILDEAYIEFASEGVAPSIEPDDQRIIRFRTFSKAYGMAGARVGYAIAAVPLASAFNKIRNHFGMCRISQAGALAALADQTYLTATVENVAASRQKIDEIARANGLTTVPSSTNFVAIDCGKDGVFAKKVQDALVARGVFVRMPFQAPQNRCIRVSAGKAKDMALFAAALPLALNDAVG
jgi:histidinol-phosphate aminotransferase